MKVLVWKSYGDISVHNLESEESAKKVYNELIEVLNQGGFYPGNMYIKDVKALVNWINFHDIGDDWDSFEYIAIKEVE